MSETIESPTKESAFKDFMQKARHAMEIKNFKGAIASLNIAGKIITDMRAAGLTVAESDVSEFKSMISEANEAAEKQDKDIKEKTVSQLTVLRKRGESNEASGKGKKAKLMSIFLFGLDAAGKTTFVDYINKERFADHSPTIGVNISRIALGSMKFVFNDVGGQQKYREQWRNYWKNPDFMLFIVDASDSTRFDQAKAYLWDVLKDPVSSNIPLIVMANKMDKPDAKTLIQVVNALDLGEIKSSDRLVGVFETSIKTNKNINQALTFVASTALSDQGLRHFVDAEIARINKNLGEFYKAYVQEAKYLEEEEKNYKSAIDRVTRAKLVQEELFKQGFSKAAKEIAKCGKWLARLNELAK